MPPTSPLPPPPSRSAEERRTSPVVHAAVARRAILRRGRGWGAMTLLALLGGAGGGCSVLPDRPYVETRRFPLLPRRPARGGGGGGAPGGGGSTRAGAGGGGAAARKVLLLRLVRAAPGLEQRGLRTLRADGSVDVDFYAEWAAPPAELAEEAMRRWLSESGLFSAVITPGSRAEAGLVLEMELSALLADLRGGGGGAGVARAELSGVLLDGSGRVLAQLTPRGEAPIARTAAGGAPTPEAIAAATEAALAGALASLERSIARFA